AELELSDACSDVAVEVGKIGTKFNIAGLKGTIWTVDGKIREGIDIRRKFYGPAKAYQQHWDELMTRQINQKFTEPRWANNPMLRSGTYVCPGATRGSKTKPPHLNDQNDGAVDHKEPVTSHWQKTGRKSDQDIRETWYGSVDNLEILCASCNGMKGSGGETYNRAI